MTERRESLLEEEMVLLQSYEIYKEGKSLLETWLLLPHSCGSTINNKDTYKQQQAG